MRAPLPLALVTIALVAAGCLEPNQPAPGGGSDDGGGGGNPQPVAFRTLAQGQHSGLPETRTVVTDPAVWETLWEEHASRQDPAPPAPEVDFANERVLAAVLEQKGSGCWWVEVTSVNATSEGLVATVTTYAEPPGMVCPAVVTQPFHFVAIPKAGAVQFEERTVTGPPPGQEPAGGGAQQEGGSGDAEQGNGTTMGSDEGNATVRTLAAGSHSGHRGGVQRVIEWEHGWDEFWRTHASSQMPPPERPPVDFETERVAIVVLEDKPNGCWAVRLEGYGAGPDAANLTVVTYAPPPDVMCTSVITQPFHFVAIPKGPPVTFEARDATGPPPEA